MPAGGEIVVMSEAYHSGSGRYLLHLANALSHLRPVVLVSPEHELEAMVEPGVRRRLLPSLQTIRPLLLKALGMQYQTLCRMWQGLLLRRRAAAYVLVHPGKVLFVTQLLAVLRLFGRRVVLNVHDVRPHARQLRFLPPAVENWICGLCYRLPHAIVVLTRTAAQELQELHGIAASRIAIVPHGDFALAPTVLPPPAEERCFLVFGGMRANKCVMESIVAFQALRREDPAARLIVAGQASKEEAAYWQSCKAQIARAPDGIDLREGYVADADLPALFASSSALLLPYRDFASQSGVAVMAVASGRPIIAAPTGGMTELFAAGDVGVAIAEPATADSIAEALRRFAERPIAARYRGVVAAAALLAEEQSWPSVAAGYLRVVTGAR